MTQYARGRRKEYEVVKRFRAHGWLAQRSAGSHGLWDVVAVKAGTLPVFVQVKYTARWELRTPKRHTWEDANSDALLKLGDETWSDTVLDVEVWVYERGNAEPHIFCPWQGRWVKEPATSADW